MWTRTSKLRRYVQVWALLLVFLGGWALATVHHHDSPVKDHVDCATCHLQRDFRSADGASSLSLTLPALWVEPASFTELDFRPSLTLLLTKDAQAPPQA